jgi:hypothetical protein
VHVSVVTVPADDHDQLGRAVDGGERGGVMVLNSAASPVFTVMSRSPKESRTRPLVTKNQS